MAAQGASSSTASRSGTARALHVVLWLLAVLVFAQAVFAGLFLDGNTAWRRWHAGIRRHPGRRARTGEKAWRSMAAKTRAGEGRRNQGTRR